MSIRRRGDNLQTSVDTYRHLGIGRTVTLIATMHLGNEDYFKKIERIISMAEARGAEIHYEGVKAPPSDVDRTPAEQSLLDRLTAARGFDMLLPFINVASQRRVTLRESWHNTDMNQLQVIRALPDPEGFISLMEGPTDVPAGHDIVPRRVAVLMPTMLLWAPVIHNVVSAAASLRRLLPRARRSNEDVILEDRNHIAIAAALGTESDVAATWGAAHLPGIGTGLEAAGFQRVSRRWLTAYTRPADTRVIAALRRASPLH